MRKRSEAGQQPMAESKPAVDPENYRKLPIEDDHSAMMLELKGRGYQLGVSDVAAWLPNVRHIVAMWIAGQLEEDDIPEAIKRFKVSPETPRESLERKMRSEHTQELTGAEQAELANVNVRRNAVPAPESNLRSIEGGKKESPKPNVISLDATGLEALEMMESVTVTWGSEKYQPFTGSNYSNYEVGMISRTIHVRAGEDARARVRAVKAELKEIFEEMREEKKESFLRHMASHKPSAK